MRAVYPPDYCHIAFGGDIISFPKYAEEVEPLYLYYLLGQKNFRRNLQYRAAHVIDNFGSALFGYITIYIWKAAGTTRPAVGDYTVEMLVLWAAMGQVLFHFSVNAAHGLGIQGTVRNGAVVTDFLRPMNYFFYITSREAGQQFYNLFYRSAPIFVLYAVTVGYHVPALPSLALFVPAALIALYVCLCVSYLVGLSSFITVDNRWATRLNMALFIAMSGYIMPTDLLPGGKYLRLTPWAVMAHYPNRIYFGLDGIKGLTVPLIWSAALTGLCLWATHRARRSLEVQGG